MRINGLLEPSVNDTETVERVHVIEGMVNRPTDLEPTGLPQGEKSTKTDDWQFDPRYLHVLDVVGTNDYTTDYDLAYRQGLLFTLDRVHKQDRSLLKAWCGLLYRAAVESIQHHDRVVALYCYVDADLIPDVYPKGRVYSELTYETNLNEPEVTKGLRRIGHELIRAASERKPLEPIGWLIPQGSATGRATTGGARVIESLWPFSKSRSSVPAQSWLVLCWDDLIPQGMERENLNDFSSAVAEEAGSQRAGIESVIEREGMFGRHSGASVVGNTTTGVR